MQFFILMLYNLEQGFMKVLVAALSALALLENACQSQAALIGHWTLDNNTTGIQNQGTNGAPSNLVANGTMPTFTSTGGYDGGGYATFTGTQGLFSTTAGNAAAALASAGGYPFSYAAWVRVPNPVPALGSGRATIMAISTTTSTGDFVTMSIGYPEDRDFESNRRFGVTTNLTDADGSAATLINGVWHHVAAVFASSSSLAMYVDGVLQTNNPAAVSAVTFPSTVNAVNIGVFQRTSATDRYRGDIDDARLYDVALTGPEVAALAVPEPKAILLFGISLIGLSTCCRGRKR
jgi:hypothetical protein